ncbi:MAG: transposase [Gammaproteobacteria bacterium]
MTTHDFITELFCKVDEELMDIPKHPQALMWPGELVTIGLLFAIKGVGTRAFYRWLSNNYLLMFPKLPHRTRLFRLLRTHRSWTDCFLASPTMLGVIDSYGIELIHPVREGRSPRQRGKKGISNHRWIVGGKLCMVLNHLGLVSAWDCDTANVHDTRFQHLIQRFSDQMVILGDMGFHAAEGDPSNLKLCERGEWNERMMVETVLSMLTLVCHFKKVTHRVWDYFQTRLGFTMAAFNLLVQWNGLKPDDNGFVQLSIADFSL